MPRTPARVVAALVLAGAGCAPSPPGVVHRSAPAALGPYSGSVAADGFVFVSGKIGRGHERFADEAQAALQAVAEELARAGLGLADVVSVTVYLTDLETYGEFNAIYAAHLAAPYPARACVEVARLPGGARVEVQAIALRRLSRRRGS